MERQKVQHRRGGEKEHPFDPASKRKYKKEEYWFSFWICRGLNPEAGTASGVLGGGSGRIEECWNGGHVTRREGCQDMGDMKYNLCHRLHPQCLMSQMQIQATNRKTPFSFRLTALFILYSDQILMWSKSYFHEYTSDECRNIALAAQ